MTVKNWFITIAVVFNFLLIIGLGLGNYYMYNEYKKLKIEDKFTELTTKFSTLNTDLVTLNTETVKRMDALNKKYDDSVKKIITKVESMGFTPKPVVK